MHCEKGTYAMRKVHCDKGKLWEKCNIRKVHFSLEVRFAKGTLYDWAFITYTWCPYNTGRLMLDVTVSMTELSGEKILASYKKALAKTLK